MAAGLGAALVTMGAATVSIPLQLIGFVGSSNAWKEAAVVALPAGVIAALRAAGRGYDWRLCGLVFWALCVATWLLGLVVAVILETPGRELQRAVFLLQATALVPLGSLLAGVLFPAAYRAVLPALTGEEPFQPDER